MRRLENVVNPPQPHAYTNAMTRTSIASLFILLFVSAAARAQDHGDFGIVVAYPGSIGAEWHLSDRVALRPDLSFVFNGTDSTTTNPFGGSLISSIEGKTIGVGISGLV